MDQISLLKNSIVLLTGIVIYQAITIQQLKRNLRRGRFVFENLSEATTYLINILEKNNVELSEFDVIALTDIFEGETNASIR